MASRQLITLDADGGLSFRMSNGSTKSLAEWGNDQNNGLFSVYLVIDCSGSMDGQKLLKAKKGSKDFNRSALADGYSVGLISFSDNVQHLVPPTRNEKEVVTGIDRLKIQGGTNLAPAINEVMERFKDKEDYTLAMVIVTDGITINPELALRSAEKAKSMGISILTIGTDDADSSFLSKLASESELSTHVPNAILEEAISNSAQLLPRGK